MLARRLAKGIFAPPRGATRHLGVWSDALERASRRTAALANTGATQTHGMHSQASTALLDGFGAHCFKGAVADRYLAKQGLAAGTIEAARWNHDAVTADLVAAGLLEWATDHGASSFAHWFQPLAACNVRHGGTGQVQNAFFKFDAAGEAVWDLAGKDLLKGETDGSSYPNGGLRATHTAGGYLTPDPTSPMFLRGDTVFIPSCFVSYHGHALDEKTPLLRASDALSREGSRLLALLGYEVDGLQANIGLEQELFLIPRAAYAARPDLQMCGRTVVGRDAPRGQEMCDHYMSAPSFAHPAQACMADIQRQCYAMGIPLRTRHREVAPGQYEFAPLFGAATTQVDQNVVVMQVIEEVAAHHGLAALLQEKPFHNINGSGKHNNWSIGTTGTKESGGGVNLLNVGQLAAASGSHEIFPVLMAAIVSAVDAHGDLMRCSIATPGNDFRLGACEAPPAIVSTYLGEDMTAYLDAYRRGSDAPYVPATKPLDLGVGCIPPLEVPAEDRNRTSPFPFGGHRFEFRAVGSAQNCSIVNTVLNTIAADAFRRFADAIEGGAAPRDVAAAALDEHWKVIFNGDNYSAQAQQELTERGVWRIDSAVEALACQGHAKNVALFEGLGVMSAAECAAHVTINLEHYAGTVEVEALCLTQMISGHIVPSVRAAIEAHVIIDTANLLPGLADALATLEAAMAELHATEGTEAKAHLARTLRLETMVDIRAVCDAAEGEVPANLWTLATYDEMLFMDKLDWGEDA